MGLSGTDFSLVLFSIRVGSTFIVFCFYSSDSQHQVLLHNVAYLQELRQQSDVSGRFSCTPKLNAVLEKHLCWVQKKFVPVPVLSSDSISADSVDNC